VEQLVDKAGLSADENDQPWMTSLYSTSPGIRVSIATSVFTITTLQSLRCETGKFSGGTGRQTRKVRRRRVQAATVPGLAQNVSLRNDVHEAWQHSRTNRTADYPTGFGIRMQHARWRR